MNDAAAQIFALPGRPVDEGVPVTEAPWREPEVDRRADGPARPGPVSDAPRAERESEVIHTPDQRQLVPDTLAVPNRWICSLDVTWPGADTPVRGTGVLIGPRHVLTAAHAIYRAEDGLGPESVYVVPAQDGRSATGSVVEPFGRIKAVAYSVPGEFLKPICSKSGKCLESVRTKSRFDFALITLERDVSGLTADGGQPLGYWGNPRLGAKTVLRGVDPAFLQGKPAYVCGYPGDWCGPTRVDRRVGCDGQHLAAAQVVHHGLVSFPAVPQMAGLFLHTADTYGGQSGAPVWMEFNDGSCYLIGIHVGGYDVFEGDPPRLKPVIANQAVHLSADVLALVRSWMP